MTWTRFWDMHSGGKQKEPWHYIFIETSQEEAQRVFYAKFGHNPNRITCTCCGEDYSIDEEETLENITGFYRHCQITENGYIEEPSSELWRESDYQTLEQFLARPDVKVIYANEITDKERSTYLPSEGWVYI